MGGLTEIVGDGHTAYPHFVSLERFFSFSVVEFLTGKKRKRTKSDYFVLSTFISTSVTASALLRRSAFKLFPL